MEHAQHVAPADLDRFAPLGVIASVQPYHVIDDGRWAETRIGPQRATTAYPFRSFADRHVRLAIGTDWPVAPLDPMLGLYAAATRATLDGRNPDGWVPEQKISVAEAIDGYTRTAAWAEFQERDKGTLAPGKLADLVVLGEDPFAIPPERLREVKVDLTLVGGRVVFDRDQGREEVSGAR
jgi:predicted amidohydrolase YtcJ